MCSAVSSPNDSAQRSAFHEWISSNFGIEANNADFRASQRIYQFRCHNFVSSSFNSLNEYAPTDARPWMGLRVQIQFFET